MRLVLPSTTLLLAAATFLAACDGKSAHDGGTAPATPAASPGAPAEPKSAFDGMDHEERADFMKRVVLPAMKAAFGAVDPDEFSRMNCVTCHGDGAKEKTYAMPNPKLPKLPGPADQAGWEKLGRDEPEMMEFMKSKVVPMMAEMLGEPPYDPTTHKGFGCFHCHLAAK